MKQYLFVCDQGGIVPSPSPFVMGKSTKFDMHGKALLDSDLYAIAQTSTGVLIEECDLSDNLLLSDKALAHFLEVLFLPPTNKSLRRLSLARCTKAGHAGLENGSAKAGSLSLESVVRLLSDDGAVYLKILDLSGIPMGMRCHLPLCQAIQRHAYLTNVSLENTGLGNSSAVRRCVGELVASNTVQTLDLGWNCFSADVFSHLGEKLVEMGVVKSLRLANCSAASTDNKKAKEAQGNITPLVFFLEHLTRDQTLTHLDISLNRIDFQAALIVEDALSNSKKLQELNISHNPMGVLGMRGLLRLLSYEKSGLVHFHCEDCFTGESSEDATGPYQVFSALNPGGRYELHLHRPYHRALLRMLYKTCERFGLSPGEMFCDDQPKMTHPGGKDSNGVWPVATQGTFNVTFNMERCIESAMKGLDEWDFEAILERYNSSMRFAPGFKKVIPLLGQWQECSGLLLEQTVMLDALSKDFLLAFPHVHQMCESKALVSRILSRLLPCISGGRLARYQSLMLVRSVGEFVGLPRLGNSYLNFTAENPTGSYKLDLANPMDAYVANQLLVLDRWETNLSKKKQMFDTSEIGNLSCIRNVKHAQKPLIVANIAEWIMPEQDHLEFDYCSRKRPPKGQKALPEKVALEIQIRLENMKCRVKEKLEALRAIAPLFYVNAMMLRTLLGIFRSSSARAELLVNFFFRVVDMYNEKLFRVRFDKDADIMKLRKRLGFLTYYPCIQPEHAPFVFDLSFYDQRVSANLFISTALKESFHNLRSPSYVLADGSVDPLPLGVPRSWEALDRMPKDGTFSCSYICAPEDRSFGHRKAQLEKYGFWNIEDLVEEEVLFWMGLSEAPTDVLEFLYFIRAKFKDSEQAFMFINGENGTGNITMREFEEGYAAMKCWKFKGPTELQRVGAVFRYLDPSDEGQVCLSEFKVMDILWNEVMLTIRECVQFCYRTFGPDLKDAWKEINPDGLEELDAKAFASGLKGVGFYGPAGPIFDFLDEDDGGKVTLEEVLMLDRYGLAATLAEAVKVPMHEFPSMRRGADA